MVNEDHDRRVLLFVGDDYEDLELQYPRLRLREAGYQPLLAGLEAGAVYRGKHGYPQRCDVALADVAATPFVGVICPGGWMPDKLRRFAAATAAIRACDERGRLVASICHGGWMCISAGVVRGRRYTGSPGIRDDLVNAGARFEDAEVVVDGHHVSSRKPDDLPAFLAACLEVLGRAP
ncbi:MAG: type 1 glutamine amidotransferase [Planctomycetes bacterium]|nr:type 1 glutamine amidotransferase [Planctomycetota bacterium]